MADKISTGVIADNAINLAKLAGGTDGNLISFDASGDPAAVATGTSGQVLTSNGAGAAPTFQNNTGASGLVKIASQTASSSSSIDFVNGTGGVVLDNTYNIYKIFITDLIPASDATILELLTSTNAGGAYDTGASDYSWGGRMSEMDGAIATADFGDNSDDSIQLSNGALVGTGTGESFNAEITIYSPAGTQYTIIKYECDFVGASGNLYNLKGTGARLSAADVDATRFIMSSGNIASGIFSLYAVATPS